VNALPSTRIMMTLSENCVKDFVTVILKTVLAFWWGTQKALQFHSRFKIPSFDHGSKSQLKS